MDVKRDRLHNAMSHLLVLQFLWVRAPVRPLRGPLREAPATYRAVWPLENIQSLCITLIYGALVRIRCLSRPAVIIFVFVSLAALLRRFQYSCLRSVKEISNSLVWTHLFCENIWFRCCCVRNDMCRSSGPVYKTAVSRVPSNY